MNVIVNFEYKNPLNNTLQKDKIELDSDNKNTMANDAKAHINEYLLAKFSHITAYEIISYTGIGNYE